MPSTQQPMISEINSIQVAFNYYDTDRPTAIISQTLTVDMLYQAYMQMRHAHGDNIPLEWTITTEVIDGVKTDVLDVADWDISVDEYGDIVGNYQILGTEAFNAKAFITKDGGALFVLRPCDPKRLFKSLQRQGVACSFDEQEFMLNLPGWTVFLSSDSSTPFIPRGGLVGYKSMTMHQSDQLINIMSNIMSELNTQEEAQAMEQHDTPEQVIVAEEATIVSPEADIVEETSPAQETSPEAAETAPAPASTALGAALMAAAGSTSLGAALMAAMADAEVDNGAEDAAEETEALAVDAVANEEALDDIVEAVEPEVDQVPALLRQAEPEDPVLQVGRSGLDNKPYSGNKHRRNRREENEFRDIPDPTESGLARGSRYGAFSREKDEGRQQAKPKQAKQHNERPRYQKPEAPVVDYGRIGRVQMNSDVLQKLSESMRNSVPKDGIDSINIGPAATTELGKALMGSARTPFHHPDFGQFDTLLGFQYFILSNCSVPRLRTLSGTALRNWRKNNNQLRYFQGWMTVVAEAFWFKVHTVPGLVEKLVGNDLPFHSYYFTGEGDLATVCNTVDEPWMVGILNEIVRALKARAKAKDDDARAKIVPKFGFLAAMEQRKVANYGANRK